MRVIQCEQRSAEWYQARTGKPTASRFADVLDRLKTGKPGAKRTNYIAELAVERLTGSMVEKFVTKAMERGTELEPEARASYEANTAELVDALGFALHDTLECGCSPDGLVGSDGLVEIKCPENILKIAEMWRTRDFSDYEAQVHGQMWITGRKWCDLVIYDPRLKRAGMDTLIHRFHQTEEWVSRLETEMAAFIAEVDAYVAEINERKAA